MKRKLLNLQLFGDVEEGGAAEGTGGTADPTSAGSEGTEGAAPEGAAPEGTADSPSAPDAGSEPSFEDLIKGKYKEDYDKAVRGAISKRFRNQKNLQKELDSLNPMFSVLGQKYGIRPGDDGKIDLAALQKAVEDDNSMYEQEAFEKGVDVETLKTQKRLEAENARLRHEAEMTERERQSRAEFDQIVQQGEAVKQIYPNFNLSQEMDNPEFMRLITAHVPVQTAYEVSHKDEILSQSMQYAVQQTEKKITNAVKAGQKRPAENGMSQKPAADTGKMDPSKLTLKDFEEIQKRVARGERITF